MLRRLFATLLGPPAPTWSVYFSPHGNCSDAILRVILAAKKTILVQAYSFTSLPIAQSLTQAKLRGVDVRVIVDAKAAAEHGALAGYVANAGVLVWLDSAHAIAHNKIMVIDNQTVITGSYNFSGQAETADAENLLVVSDALLAKRYADNWVAHCGHSKPLPPPGKV